MNIAVLNTLILTLCLAFIVGGATLAIRGRFRRDDQPQSNVQIAGMASMVVAMGIVTLPDNVPEPIFAIVGFAFMVALALVTWRLWQQKRDKEDPGH